MAPDWLRVEASRAYVPAWALRAARRLGGARIVALPILRILSISAGWLWVLLQGDPIHRLAPLVLALAAFTAYSALLLALVLLRPAATLRYHVPVLVADLSFALLLVRLSGGAGSVLYLALLLIAGLQAYYYGIARGLLVAAVAAAGYVGVSWTTIGADGRADVVIELMVLIGTALGVGLIGSLEEAERLEASRLRHDAAERELFIRDIVDSLDEGVIVLTDQGRVALVNSAAEKFAAGGPPTAARDLASMFPGFDVARVRVDTERLLTGRAQHFTLSGIEHGVGAGRRTIVDVAGGVLRRGGRPAGVVLVVRDVTQRVGLEQSARRAEKLAALGTLAAGLAHELNNPIGIIFSRIEVMLMEAERMDVPSRVLEDLNVLHRHAARVARIARGLLSFARPGPGQFGPIDINDIVVDTLLLAEKQLAKAGVTVRRVLDPGLPPIRGNVDTLQQVVLNLVTNAADAIADDGEIVIETRALADPPGAVALRVSDTGSGIDPGELAKIFDPFYTTKPQGTGLGLSVSHQIVRDHGATIDVTSSPDGGTTFVVTFPPATSQVSA
jgi:PAS domain S-box-containing protein